MTTSTSNGERPSTTRVQPYNDSVHTIIVDAYHRARARPSRAMNKQLKEIDEIRSLWGTIYKVSCNTYHK